MRSAVIICLLVAASASYLAADNENSNSGSVDRLVEALNVFEKQEGCTWSRFNGLVEVMKKEKIYPAPLMIQMGYAKQFGACKERLTDFPCDGLQQEERNKLAEFTKRITGEPDSPRAVVGAVLSLIKEQHDIDSKGLKKLANTQQKFKSLFDEQMDFCFQIDQKLLPYYEFVDQMLPDEFDLEGKMPILAERIKLGMPCHVLVENPEKLAKMAFQKAIGKWYNFKRLMTPQ